ncbi:MAG: trypsin-like peptidase domain-containing protein [Bacteroidota bacterium]
MTTRRVLLGLLLVAAGLAVGLLAARWLWPGVTDDGARPIVAVAPPPETVTLGRQAPYEEPLPRMPQLDAMDNLFQTVAKRVTPTVVFIRVETRGRGDGFQPFQREPFRRSAGSGVVVSDEGFILTNHHVVDDGDRIQVLFDDGREFDARMVGTDPSTDLAVIQLVDYDPDNAVPVIALGDSDEVEVGQWVLAVGNPFRLRSTVTAGIVSALGRQVDIIADNFRIEDFIQTDAAINPGNSGGALVNLRGELVGIATAIATESGSYEGYGFAVPSNLAVRVAQDLIATGEVQRGYLGVEIRPVTEADAEAVGLDRIAGVLIAGVANGGAADQAGLRRGDVLTAIDGVDLDAPNQFQSQIARRRPGDVIALDVWRRGRTLDLDVRLFGRDDAAFQAWMNDLGTEQPGLAPGTPELPEGHPDLPEGHPALPEGHPEIDPDLEPDGVPESVTLESWGVELRDLTDRERDLYNVRSGAFVEDLAESGTAALGGLPAGTVITSIELEDGRPRRVQSAEQAAQALALAEIGSRVALVEVRRPDGTVAFYELMLGDA